MGARTPQLTVPTPKSKLRETADYEQALAASQFRLMQIQQASMRTGQRSIVVLEGWDAAGKGGLIRRMTARLDPRFCRVIPVAEPKPDEQGRHFLYRFWLGLPVPGSITVFDRSWYGRVLVERVEKLCPVAAWQRAYDEINAFEKMLVDDGVRMVKIFLHVSAEEQLRRFQERLETPHKRWKLTMSDLRNLERRGEYEHAINDMLAQCHTRAAPWHVVASDFKWWSRCAALENIVETLGKNVDLSPPAANPTLAKKLKALKRSMKDRKKPADRKKQGKKAAG